MTTVNDEVIGTEIKGVFHMEAFNTATGGFADTVFDGDDNDGTVIFFLKTGSGDADYAFMPVFTDDNNNFIFQFSIGVTLMVECQRILRVSFIMLYSFSRAIGLK